MGFLDEAAPITFQLYSETLQKFRLAAEGHGAVQPPERHRERIRAYFDPLPFWYRPLEDAGSLEIEFPLHAITQRPMAMYHSWGGMNAWLRQIHGSNRLYLARARAGALGLADDDWVWVTSRHGRIKAQIRTMEGVSPDVCWTWNAIGKRAGAWRLAPNAPEVQKGFLLNHLIDELLPEREGGYRYANADPVTGQAAWYDLRVRIEKAAAEEGISAPQLPRLHAPPSLLPAAEVLRYGEGFRPRGGGGR
jgi:anaerobic selenocysteine-containing dehydrogenase